MQSAMYLIQTKNRFSGIRSLVQVRKPPVLSGKRVLLEVTFTRADPFPASTYHDALHARVEEMRRMGADPGRADGTEQDG